MVAVVIPSAEEVKSYVDSKAPAKLEQDVNALLSICVDSIELAKKSLQYNCEINLSGIAVSVYLETWKRLEAKGFKVRQFQKAVGNLGYRKNHWDKTSEYVYQNTLTISWS